MLVNTTIAESSVVTTFACDGKPCYRELSFRTMRPQTRGPIPVVGETLPGWLRASLKRRRWSSSATTGRTFCEGHTITPVVEEIEEVLPPAQQRKANLAAAKERADRRRENARARQKEFLDRKSRRNHK